jgi:hypothetical protein
MASIYDNIRAALEVKLSNVSGLPEVAWENLTYEPTTGTSFVKPRLIPTIREPAVRGLNPQIYYQGLFRVDCFVPEGLGPRAADELADKIIDAFEATTSIYYEPSTNSILTESGAFLITESGGKVLQDGVINLSIRYSEREQGMPDGAFFMVPVNISWYIYN